MKKCLITGKPAEEWEDGQREFQHTFGQATLFIEELYDLQSQVSFMRTSLEKAAGASHYGIGQSPRLQDRVSELIDKGRQKARFSVLLLGENTALARKLSHAACT